MTLTHESLSGTPPHGEAQAPRQPWGLSQWLAVAAVPLLFLEAWTLIAWLADGPHQVTEFRTEGLGLEWWGARIAEGAVILISAIVLTIVVRGCLRQRRILTFDVMFCISGALMIWGCGGLNIFQPNFVYTSEFVNLTDVCGHLPFVVNPDCGRLPIPIIFLGLLFTFGLLGIAMLIEAVVVRPARRRWPHVSNAKLLGLILVASAVISLAEPLFIIPMHLWSYPGAPWALELGGDAWRWPIFPEYGVFILFAGLPAALRIFRDERGRTIVERGLDHYRPGLRTAITLLATYTVIQLVLWIPGTMPDWILGWRSTEWGQLPLSVNNALCDQPGVIEGTRYGPCPGSPGYRMPVSGSLTGESP
jgi:hypothetical protein